jgi:nucleoside-diphosphate-sugar epimerase
MWPQSEKIVITGASGFVGRYLIECALARRLGVVAVSRRGVSQSGVTDVRVSDYTDIDELTSIFRDAKAVVHLAARAHQMRERHESNADLYEHANVRSAQAVAVACRRANVGRFVLLSSIGVNGSRTRGMPFTERDAPAPAEAYAVSKWHAEQVVAAELAEGPTDFVILRPPLVYAGDCPGNFRALLQLVAKSPLIPLGGIGSLRTFIGAHNLCDAILIAADHQAVSRKSFLIADARSLPLGQIIRLLAKGMGRSPRMVVNLPISYLSVAALIMGKLELLDKLTAELQVDAAEFVRLTGWSRRFSPEEGLAAAGAAFRSARKGPTVANARS